MKIIDPLAVQTIFEQLPPVDLPARHLLYLVDETSPPPFAFDTNICRLLKIFRWQPCHVGEYLPRPLHFIFVTQQTASLSKQLLTAKIDWSCQIELSATTSQLSVLLAILKIIAKANDNNEFYLLVANNLLAAIAGQLFASGALTIDGLTKFLAISNDELLPYRADFQKIGRKKIAKLICHPLPQATPLDEYLSPVTTVDEIAKILNSPHVAIPNYDRYRENELIEMATSLAGSRC